MWECDFEKLVTGNAELKALGESQLLSKFTPLNPRDVLFGGRTDACRLYHKCEDGETILYYDVCSLYPYVNKYCKNPIGHPKKN